MTEIGELDLQAYLDGQLDPEREAEVLAWLETSSEARERVRSYAAHSLLLRVATEEVDLRDRVRAPVDAATGSAAAVASRFRAPRWAAQAAVLLLTFALGWGANGAADMLFDDDLPGYAREALQSHEAFAEPAEPSIEVPAGNRAEVVRWLSAKLGEPVDVPELRPMGLHLVGARLVGLEEGAGALLIYEDAQRKRLTISMAPDAMTAPDELRFREADGFIVGYWRGQRFAYALIAKSTPLQMAEIAMAVGAPVR